MNDATVDQITHNGDTGLRSRKRFAVVLVAATALVWASCDNFAGIYYTVATEEETVDNTLENDLSVTDLVVDATNNYYFAAAGLVFARPTGAGSDEWAAITSDFSDGKSGGLVTALGSDTTNLYAGFVFDDDSAGLYTTTLAAIDTSSGVSITWTPVGTVTDQVVRIMFVDSTLFITTATPDGGDGPFTYDTWAGFVQIAGLTGTDNPVTSITHDGARFWATAGPTVYSDGSTNDATAIAEVALTGPSSIFGYGGIVYDSTAATLYLSNRDGRLYSSTDSGANWSEWPVDGPLTVGGDPVAFTEPLVADQQVLIGTRGDGYYTVTNDILDDDNVTRFDEFTSELYGAAIERFVLDGSVVFACTAGLGLWQAPVSVDTLGEWVHE